MIGIQLKGRLGNQMFQYAAARTLAERLGCGLVLAGHTLGPRFGLAGHWSGMDKRRPTIGKQQNGLLRRAFGVGPGFSAGRCWELALPSLRKTMFSREFSPRRFSLNGDNYEEFDLTFFSQPSGTWLTGWFQSADYFAPSGERVRQWFRPQRTARRQVAEISTQWPAPLEQMVALHVRRGDYGEIRDALSDERAGWLLPTDYYRHSLAQLPPGLKVAIFSDDPDWAEQEFKEWHPWVSRGHSSVVDLFLMARCRYNIIANSSFSWWAAWLNEHPGKIIMAPKYHLGWRLRCWVPGGIEVAGWDYLQPAA